MTRRTLELLLYWIMVIAAVILIAVWSAALAEASIAECIDATCRITAGDGGRGTGCAFERSKGHVYVLTAAHVVGNSRSVQCEFWRAGHQSEPLPGVVIDRSPAADAAVVAVPEAAFGGLLPKTVPIAPRDWIVRPGTTLLSVGCANGTWSTGWKGHALGYRGPDLHFLPPPANGRSGSAIFDAAGERIVGLLRARTGNNSEGIASSLQTLYAAPRSQRSGVRDQADRKHPRTAVRGVPIGRVHGPAPADPTQVDPTQCPGGNCPTPRRLLPYRQQQDERFRHLQERSQNPWPTLPPRASIAIMALSMSISRIRSFPVLLCRITRTLSFWSVPARTESTAMRTMCIILNGASFQ